MSDPREPPPAHQDENPEIGLAEVLQDELRYIDAYRTSVPLAGRPAMNATVNKTLQDHQRALNESGAAALCLSGGGIRSATFSLGVIQGLAKLGLLGRFDYLSTVSGGGYVGSWLSSWAFRTGGLDKVEEALQTHAPPELAPRAGDNPAPLEWLRNYSNYLAPKAGLVSVDTWTLVATYVRNLLIVWMALVPPLMLLLFLPRLLYHALLSADYAADTVRLLTTGLALASVLLLAIGEWKSYTLGNKKNERDTPMTYVRWVNVPYTMGAFVLGLVWIVSPALEGWSDVVPRFVLIWIAVATVIGIVLEWRWPKEMTRVTLWSTNRYDIVACLIQGVVMFLALAAFIKLTSSLPPADWQIAIYPVVMLAAMGAGDLFYAAFLSRRASDEDRERWARSAAWFAILGFAWLAWTGLALIAPKLLRASADWSTLWHALDAVAATILGAVLARIGLSEKTKPAESASRTPWQAYLVPVAMVLFVVLVLALLSSLNLELEEALSPEGAIPVHWGLGGFVAVVLAVICGGVMRGININRFSLHAMYRDRLIRAYLGATRRAAPTNDKRFEKPPPEFAEFKPGPEYDQRWIRQGQPRGANPHTGFDDADNPDLFWLGLNRRQPLWVVNMALNVVDSREHLSWQERKAASFTASPLHCGAWLTGYRRTWMFGGPEGGISVGTAIAISGAAANPNMGYHSSPAMTFLMTFFNARLGWWLGNPSAATPGNRANKKLYLERSPSNGLFQLLKELFGKTDARSDWVHLSDGGHFENLGLYEMIIRRCKFIVLCDGGADSKREFEDLGNAIRKIRIDLGVQIDPTRTNVRRIGPRGTVDGIGHALFTIKYPGNMAGTLLYIKPSVYVDDAELPRDVAQYAATSEEFPHESTVDQFFSESQFESYRALGYYQLTRGALCGMSAGADLEAAFKFAAQNAQTRPAGSAAPPPV